MKRRTRGMLAVAAASVTVVSGVAFAPAAIAAPAEDPTSAAAQRLDNRPGPLTARQDARRKAAQKLILSGQASPERRRRRPAGRRQVLRGSRHRHRPAVHDPVGVRRPGQRQARHGARARCTTQIAEPDRTVDNSTALVARLQHARTTRTSSSARVSRSQTSTPSSRRATTPSTARSATGCRCPATPPPTATTPSRTSAAPGSSSRTPATRGTPRRSRPARSTPTSRPSSRRSTCGTATTTTSDGNFDEPDGYIDHFQAVHAGEGEDAGGGAQGEDAIWSHRWYVNATDYGLTGPTVGGDDVRFGGAADRRHRLLDRRLHRRGRERRPRRVRARVRPRPRPARLLRHQRRRERHRLLDAHVQRARG